MLTDSFIVLDFETSGLYCDQGDRIIEIAALRVIDRRVVERFETLVKSPAHITHSITNFTGITVDMLEQSPAVEQVIPDLLDFIGSDLVFAHNAAFDQAFLQSECHRLNIDWQLPDLLCTVKLARMLFPEMRTHALGALASSLKLPFTPGAHRAASDAQATVGVLLRMMDILCERYSLNAFDLRQLQRVLQMPTLQAITVLSTSVAQTIDARAA